jgi:hypothetical protein
MGNGCTRNTRRVQQCLEALEHFPKDGVGEQDRQRFARLFELAVLPEKHYLYKVSHSRSGCPRD